MKAKVHRKKPSQRRHQKRNRMPLVLLAVGVLLGAGLVAYISALPTATASTEYHPDEVAYNQPILAIHEMGEGPSIPFLPRNQAQPKIQVPEKFYNFGSIGAPDSMIRPGKRCAGA